MVTKNLLTCIVKVLACIVTVLASLLLTVCEGQTKLPKEMPGDARMSFAANGGMSPYLTQIEIKGDALTFREKMPKKDGTKISQASQANRQDDFKQ